MTKKLQKFVLICCLVVSCQKKEEKNLPRCIYDHNVFAAASLGAVQDNEQFAKFKKNPFLNLLWENLSKEEGEKWLGVIECRHPHLKERFEKFRESDQAGSPRVFSFGQAGEFSPSTLRLAAIAGELQSKVGSWEGMHVVQIGAGYGGLCKILSDISNFASYTLVDLPEQLALAKKYLEGFGVKNVTFLAPDQLPKKGNYDLVVSDGGFSEFSRPLQELFFDRVLGFSRAGFLLGRVFPKHYGVVSLSPDEIRRRFEKMYPKNLASWPPGGFKAPQIDSREEGCISQYYPSSRKSICGSFQSRLEANLRGFLGIGSLSHWEMQEPTIEDENYLIYFRWRN